MCLERVVPFAFDILFLEWSLFADLTASSSGCFLSLQVFIFFFFRESLPSELWDLGSGIWALGCGCARSPLHRRESDLSLEIPSCTLDPPLAFSAVTSSKISKRVDLSEMGVVLGGLLE